MKKTIVKILIPAVTQRANRILFDSELPFRGRRETPKTVYRRHPKNRKSDQTDTD